MAVDVSALIAESIDAHYRWNALVEQSRAKTQALIDQVLSGQLQEAAADPTINDPAKNHPDRDVYRRGYKTGWKASYENRPSNPTEEGAYKDGYDKGYEASGHAKELLRQHAGTNHEDAADYNMMNITAHHYGDLLQRGGQGQRFQDSLQWWEAPRKNKKSGQQVHTRAVEDAAHVISNINNSLDTQDGWKQNSAGEWEYQAANDQHDERKAPHPADYSRAIGNTLMGHANRHEKRAQELAGEEGGQERYNDFGGRTRRGLSGGGEGLAAVPEASSPNAGADAQRAEVAQAQHDEHIRTMKGAAFGHNASAAHDAVVRSGVSPSEMAQHPDYNPTIAQFHATHSNDNLGDMSFSEQAEAAHAATVEAHEHWKKNLMDWAKGLQDAGNARFKKQSVPITQPVKGDPYGRQAFVKNDGSLAPLGTKYTKEYANAFKHIDFDPVQALGMALNDPNPEGFGHSKWVTSTMNRMPGFESGLTTARIVPSKVAQVYGLDKAAAADLTQKEGELDHKYRQRINKEASKRAEAHPEGRKIIGQQIRPHAGSYDGRLGKMRVALHQMQNAHGDYLAHNGHEASGEEEAPMWRHHYGFADYNAAIAAGEDITPEAHAAYWAKKRRAPFSKFRQVGEWADYVHKERVVESIEFMVETFQAWLYKHVDVSTENMPAIAEELFSAIQTTYGHLFEVENS